MKIIRAVKSLIVDGQGRYLLQLRDNVPTITFPAYWSLFGGALEGLETPINGIKRELYEELGYRPSLIEEFLSYKYSIEKVNIIDREVTIFSSFIDSYEIEELELMEGQSLAFFTILELQKENNVVPLDLSTVLMHGLSGTAPSLFNINYS
ncbi:MAG: NUDIX domain-containing protein [Rhodospirillaceae bacterium]|nr:NUDIX domain-containing protein [Rhodospirillaceae bacterium]